MASRTVLCGGERAQESNCCCGPSERRDGQRRWGSQAFSYEACLPTSWPLPLSRSGPENGCHHDCVLCFAAQTSPKIQNGSREMAALAKRRPLADFLSKTWQLSSRFTRDRRPGDALLGFRVDVLKPRLGRGERYPPPAFGAVAQRARSAAPANGRAVLGHRGRPRAGLDRRAAGVCTAERQTLTEAKNLESFPQFCQNCLHEGLRATTCLGSRRIIRPSGR